MALQVSFVIGLVGTALLIALSSLLVAAAHAARTAERTPRPSIFTQISNASVFLFDGDDLVDATASARALLTGSARGPWFDMVSRLEPMFPGFSQRLEGLQREGRFILCSRGELDPPLVLRAEYLGGLARFTLMDHDSDQRQPGRDGPSDLALQHELGMIRETVARLPVLIWRARADGQVIWANGAYLIAAAATLAPGQDLSWPLPRIFDVEPEPAQSGPVRRSLRLDQGMHWYEITAMESGDEMLFCAEPADRLVQTEGTLRDFMQTLTKTFAQLPIGLAVFDRNRVLQLFNPALLDLTGLPPEFLTSRPSLLAVLDAMRDASMIPEPKNYRRWRHQMSAVEEAAASGLFEETWSLPTGQTWRVTGRPHPNGALAFLFEDISNEMMRTRRYRAEAELGQGVLDAMEDAVIVFSQDGNVAMTNRAYLTLWGAPEAPALGVSGKVAAVEQWKAGAAPTLLWTDLLEYIGALGARDPWEGELRLLDGRALRCRITPLPHGATLVSFVGFRLGIEAGSGDDSSARSARIA